MITCKVNFFCFNFCQSFYLFFLIDRKLLYNFVLVSAIQQCESVMILYVCMCVSLVSWASLSSPNPIPVGHHRTLGWVPCVIQQPSTISHIIVYIGQCYFLNSSHPLFPLMYPQVHSCARMSPMILPFLIPFCSESIRIFKIMFVSA